MYKNASKDGGWTVA